MKKIIISESKKKVLINCIKESISGYSDKVNIIKTYLDNNYIKADIDDLDNNGNMSTVNLVIMLDTKKQPTKHRLTLKQLYEKLQYKYQNIISDKIERNNFLWQLVNDWYYNRISKNGNLSSY